MQTSLFLSLVIATVRLVSGNSEVKVMNSTYPCCDHPSIPFDQHCSNVIRNHDVPFAKYKQGSKNGCKSPCIEIQDGRMLLERCVDDVHVSTVCRNGMGSVHETRISFTRIPCSGPGLAPGSVGLLLLLLVFIVDLWTV